MLRSFFEKFGVTFEIGQFYPANELKLNAIEPDWLVRGSKAALVDDATFIALCYWCERRDRDAKTYAAECVKHAIEYFFGKWREEIPTDLKNTGCRLVEDSLNLGDAISRGFVLGDSTRGLEVGATIGGVPDEREQAGCRCDS